MLPCDAFVVCYSNSDPELMQNVLTAVWTDTNLVTHHYIFLEGIWVNTVSIDHQKAVSMIKESRIWDRYTERMAAKCSIEEKKVEQEKAAEQANEAARKRLEDMYRAAICAIWGIYDIT